MTPSSLADRLRALLRAHPEGLRVLAIQGHLGGDYRTSIANCLRRMPDAYVKDWVWQRTGWAAVWAVVYDKPKPQGRPITRPDPPAPSRAYAHGEPAGKSRQAGAVWPPALPPGGP